jgi:hypothetical protein
MGAIARNAANNITTSGVFTADAITNASVTGITVLAGVSDGITLISSQTASNSASISFTSGLTSTYKAYKFVFVNMNPATDTANFTFNFSTDSGSNYNVTKTSSSFRAYVGEDGSSSSLAYDGNRDLAQSTGFQIIGGDLGNGADESFSGSMCLFNPSSTTYVKHFISIGCKTQFNDFIDNEFCAGYGNTTSAVNAIQFKMSSGNFDGTIYMYGIK